MTPERWRQVEALYHEARGRPVDERAPFLAEACRGDEALRREVESLLAQHVSGEGVLDRPAAVGAAHLIGLGVSRDDGAGLTGRRLGVYEVHALLGAGGMGDVYRARDTKLGRDVAIKILPHAFTSDAERLARFEREARVLASLNHPNIGAIYGLEEADGVRALVLELVEGETLAEKLAPGSNRRAPASSRSDARSRKPGASGLPVSEALVIARQIADALDAAHERGIVHRDLKPANIVIRADGTVKVLDFGIAKAIAGEGSGADLSALPTLATMATREGLLIGTPAYMSPEQARGQAVDKRTDIWAFGCVLYEMLTGRAAFPGETISDTIAAVVRGEPAWDTLPPDTPPSVRNLLRRCLEKDPRRRARDIGDVRLEIDETRTTPADSAAASAVAAARKGLVGSIRLAWTLAVVCLMAFIAALAFGAATYFSRRPTDARTLRFFVSPPDGWRVNTVLMPTSGSTAPLTVSPDGQSLGFLARNAEGRNQLWIRALDTLAAWPLAGTDGAASPFWSPDSRWLGFFAEGQLKKIDVTGGLPITVCEAVDSRGGTWSRDGVIVFAPSFDGPLQKVSAAGGVPTAATTLAPGESDVGHDRPSFLPDGRHFLYSVNRTGGPVVYVASLDSTDRTVVLEASGSGNVVYAQGHLLYLRGTTLMAQPFDAGRRAFAGDAVPIAQEIRTQSAGVVGDFAVSETGVLVYQTDTGERRSRLEWVDRAGKLLGTLGEPGNDAFHSLSPDGTRVLVSVPDPARKNTYDIWLYDVARGLRTRFTSDPANETFPIWSPDGSRVVFTSDRRGNTDVYQKAANGTGRDEPLVQGDLNESATSWSSDGRYLLYQSPTPPDELNDLWVWPLVEGGKPVAFRQTPFGDRRARFSPDGRWVAYESNESGEFEVWVTPFPRADGKWLISTAGGTWPLWRRDSKEIFYLAPNSRLMAAEVNGEGVAFQVRAVRPLFQTRAAAVSAPYDVSANGQRFLVNTLQEDATSEQPIAVVVNWTSGLEK